MTDFTWVGDSFIIDGSYTTTTSASTPAEIYAGWSGTSGGTPTFTGSTDDGLAYFDLPDTVSPVLQATPWVWQKKFMVSSEGAIGFFKANPVSTARVLTTLPWRSRMYVTEDRPELLLSFAYDQDSQLYNSTYKYDASNFCFYGEYARYGNSEPQYSITYVAIRVTQYALIIAIQTDYAPSDPTSVMGAVTYQTATTGGSVVNSYNLGANATASGMTAVWEFSFNIASNPAPSDYALYDDAGLADSVATSLVPVNETVALTDSVSLAGSPGLRYEMTITDKVLVTEPTELIYNGSFEWGTAGWKNYSAYNEILTWDSTHVRSGYHSCKVSDTTSANIGITSLEMSVVAGTKYVAKAFCYRETSGTVSVRTRYYDASGALITAPSSDVYTYTSATAGEWSPIELIGTAPAGAVVATVSFYTYQVNNTPAWWDDAQFVGSRGPDAGGTAVAIELRSNVSTVSTATAHSNQRKLDKTSDGTRWRLHYSGSDRMVMSYSKDGENWVEPYVRRYWAGTANASKSIEMRHDGSSRVNHLTDPSFENGVTGWTTDIAGATLARSSNYAKYGTYSMQVNKTASNYIYVNSGMGTSAVPVGGGYAGAAFGCWVLSPSSSITVDAVLRFYDASGVIDDSYYKQSVTLTPGEWTWVGVFESINTGYAYVSGGIVFANDTGTFYMDGATLELVPGPYPLLTTTNSGSMNEGFHGAVPDSYPASFGFAGTGTTYTPNASLFIDEDDYAHVAYKDRDGCIYYRRGTPNATRTTWDWSSNYHTVATATTTDYPDVVAHSVPAGALKYLGTGSGWVATVVFSNATTTPSNTASYWQVEIAAEDGTSTSRGGLTLNTSYGVNAHTFPSIDFNHTGDGKTVKDGTPHLYVAWSAGATGAGKGIRFKKATYSGGTWTWGAEREIAANYTVYSSNWLNCVFNGTDIYLIGSLNNAIDYGDHVYVFTRDAADTTTTEYEMYPWAVAYGNASVVDNRVFIVGKESTEIRSRSWTVGSPALDEYDYETIDATPNSSPYILLGKVPVGLPLALPYAYTDGGASPYTIVTGEVLVGKSHDATDSLGVTDEVRLTLDSTFDWGNGLEGKYTVEHNVADVTPAQAFAGWSGVQSTPVFTDLDDGLSFQDVSTVTPFPNDVWQSQFCLSSEGAFGLYKDACTDTTPVLPDAKPSYMQRLVDTADDPELLFSFIYPQDNQVWNPSIKYNADQFCFYGEYAQYGSPTVRRTIIAIKVDRTSVTLVAENNYVPNDTTCPMGVMTTNADGTKAAEWNLGALTIAPQDSTSVWTFTPSFTTSIDDTVQATDELTFSGIVYAEDTEGLTDSIVPEWGPMLDATVGMEDWLTIRFTHGVVLDDTATLTDEQTFARDLSRTHDDTLGITDSRILGHGWNIPVEDLLGTSDSRTFTYDFGRVLSDTLGLTDFRNIDAGTRFTVDHTDNVGLTDGMVATDIEADGLDWLNLSDQVDITFISAQHWTVEQDDSLGITDYTDRAITTNVLLEETANITDVLAKARAVTIVDTEQTSDTRGFARSYTATDAMGLSDSRVTSEGEGVLRSDTENITDTASRTVTFDRNSDDGTGLTDGLESWDIGIFGEEEETLEDYVRIDLSLAAFDYTHTQPDTVGLTDSLVLALNYDRDMTDSLGVTDSTASTGTYIRNFAENVGLVDTARPNPWLTKEDPVAINDSLTRDIAKQITDAATLSDTGMVTAEDNVLSYYEDLHVTDGAQTTVVYIRDITDEMSLRDTRTAGTDTDAEEMSNLGITDELAFSFDYGKVRDDTAEVTDSTDRVVVFSRSTTDDIGIEDITGTAMELSRAADDTLSVTDSFRVNPDVTLIDGTVLDDSLLTEEFNNIFDSGTVGLSDSLVLTVDRLRPHADSESVIDSLSMDRTANSTDDLALLDATEQATGRLVTDPQGITDIGTPVVSYGRPQADSVGLTDSLSFAFEYERVLADDISNSDATTSAGSGAQNVNDNETLTDSLNIVSTYIKSIDETVGVEDSYNFEHARAVADLAGITDTRSKDVSKVLAEQAGSTDITTTGFGEVDEHRDSVGITDTLVVSQGRNIALHDNEALADNAGLSITVHLADQIGLADSTIQSRDYGVMLTDPIGLQDGQDKATSRTLMDDATASDEVVLLKFDAVPFIGWGTGI